MFNNQKKTIAYNDDVFNLLDKVTADIIYLDPPYTGTMNNYFGFYGLVDDFITSKKTKPFENNFINKKIAVELFDNLFSKLSNFKYWYLSYNNSSYPSKEDLLYLLNKYSDNVQVIERKHVYKITGKEKKETNKEYLFIIKNELHKKNMKKIMPQQNYEDYWKITVEYTDIHGERFNGTLQLIVDYIDT